MSRGVLYLRALSAQEFKPVNGVPARGGSIGAGGPTIANGMVFVGSGYVGFQNGVFGQRAARLCAAAVAQNNVYYTEGLGQPGGAGWLPAAGWQPALRRLPTGAQLDKLPHAKG
jgi:hypothetical protein